MSELHTRERLAQLSKGRVALAVVVAGFGLAVLWAFMLGNYMAATRFYGQLESNGSSVTAFVQQPEPQQHNSVTYRYTVDGMTYTASSPAHSKEGPADQLRPGQPITIVYNRSDPNISCACVPSEELGNAQSFLYIGALLTILWLTLVVIATLGAGWRISWSSDRGWIWMREAKA